MSNSTIQQRLYDPSAYWASPSRNFRSSTRLHLQHYLWQNTTRFLLEPRIQASIEQHQQIKVADLGCGNGVWLADLGYELSQKHIPAQLNGYDINEGNFPPPAFLPASVTLTKLDVLSGIFPLEAIGAFDVVHIRAFSSIIIDNNTTNLLSAALSLLKPGGWIQWEEWGTDLIIEPASPRLSTESCERIARVLKAGGDAQGLNVDFVRNLDGHLINAGFQQTEDFLIIWEEVASFFPSRAETSQSQASVTKESWAQLFADAVKEIEQGVALHRGSVFTAIGRKPFPNGERS
ncbi:hypothetical protein GGR58DRAFT_518068 [Xylaria digitata]|nr:hypothetical protein GGR58DRAFT_518068 [Xylaria digitata]